MAKTVGKKQPYTDDEIKHVKCCRCGGIPAAQWNCCANDGRWLPICAPCDVELNAYLLNFFNIPEKKKLLNKYITNL